MVATHPGPEVAAEDKVRALENVLQSETFARSERLKSLLRFLCEAEIEGRESELNEYSIGTGALGRPKDFAPLEDSSVRSRAWELRQKLEKYYSHEAPTAPIHIELRKGSYVPRFCVAPAAPEAIATTEAPAAIREEAAAPGPAAQAAVRQDRTVQLVVAAFLAGALVMFAAIAVWSANVNPGTQLPVTRLRADVSNPPWTPDLETLWKPFLDGRTPLIVEYETRFFVQMGPLVVRDWHINTLAAVENSAALMQIQRLFGLRQLYASGNYTDVGTPEALFYLTRLLNGRVNLSVKNSHEVSATELRDSNLILLGKPWLDPEIEKILSVASLVDLNGRILNRHPAPGEQAEYVDRQDKNDPDSWSEKYSVITVMPNPASGKRVLALTASGSEHPSALAYYLTNKDCVRDLLGHLRTTLGGMPQNYQILVRAAFKGKALIKVEYVTHRPLTSG